LKKSKPPDNIFGAPSHKIMQPSNNDMLLNVFLDLDGRDDYYIAKGTQGKGGKLNAKPGEKYEFGVCRRMSGGVDQ
jgi:hypothetical protein